MAALEINIFSGRAPGASDSYLAWTLLRNWAVPSGLLQGLPLSMGDEFNPQGGRTTGRLRVAFEWVDNRTQPSA